MPHARDRAVKTTIEQTLMRGFVAAFLCSSGAFLRRAELNGQAFKVRASRPKAIVLSTASNDAAIEIAVRRIGPALVFERCWRRPTAVEWSPSRRTAWQRNPYRTPAIIDLGLVHPFVERRISLALRRFPVLPFLKPDQKRVLPC